MAHSLNIGQTDDSTIKMRASGEIYVNQAGAAASGTWNIDSTGLLTTKDTSTGTTYKLTIENGLLQPVEV